MADRLTESIDSEVDLEKRMSLTWLSPSLRRDPCPADVVEGYNIHPQELIT
jgi:hypothetical protein